MAHGKVGVSKDKMCSYKHTHNGAVHSYKVYDKGRVLFTKENEKSIEYSLKSKQTTLKTTLEGKWNLTIYLNHLDVPWHCFVRACSLNTAEKKPR